MRRVLWIKKIWHSWTLDPLATGGLLVATGNYTKLIPHVEKDTKSYRATIELDGVSPSYDSDTEITFLSKEQKKYFWETISESDIEGVFQKNFFWKISQTPPKYSALKIDGKRALDRTLAGQDIEMKMREVEILSYDIISFSYPTLVVDISVSAGTYIRSIAHDLWNILGTGGYLSALRRTQVWGLNISEGVTLDDLDKGKNISPEKIFWEKIYHFDDEWVYRRLGDWQRVRWEFTLPERQEIFLSHDDMIWFVVEYKDGVIHPRKKIT